jgi:hypothetical protein
MLMLILISPIHTDFDVLCCRLTVIDIEINKINELCPYKSLLQAGEAENRTLIPQIGTE